MPTPESNRTMSLSSVIPPVVATGQIATAREPLYGGEIKVHASPKSTLEIAVHTLRTHDTGDTSLDSGYAIGLAAEPRSLLLMLKGKAVVSASADMVFTVVGTDQTGAALTGTATFKIPAWRDLPDRTFAAGYSTSVEVTAGKLFKSVVSITPAVPQNVIDQAPTGFAFVLLAIPSADSFNEIGCTTESNFNSVTRPAKTIMCGMDGKFVKRGRSPVGELSISCKTLDHFGGIRRLEGVTGATILLQPLKGDLVASEHLLFTGVTLTSNSKAGEGEDEASQSGTGQFELMAIIPAKDAA